MKFKKFTNYIDLYKKYLKAKKLRQLKKMAGFISAMKKILKTKNPCKIHKKSINYIDLYKNSIKNPIKNSIKNPIKNSIKNPIKNSINNILVNVGYVNELTFYGFDKNSEIKLCKLSNYKNEYLMLMSRKLKSIIIYPVNIKKIIKYIPDIIKKINIKSNINTAIRDYKIFKHFLPSNYIVDDIDLNNNYLIGFVAKKNIIKYTSDKFNKKIQMYIHNFKNIHNVYINKKGNCIIITNLNANNRGILS